MNRHDRRKASRHATDDEIFPGSHGPIQSDIRDLMNRTAEALQKVFPGFDITLFVAERAGKDGAEPRFNYISTADRRDMYAVLRAFLAKNEAIAGKLDKIDDAPPTDSRQ